MNIKKVDYSPTEPGIYEVSSALYHAGPGISSSKLGELMRSPAHYKARLLNPIETTPDMLIGKAVHCKVLEPEEFNKLFCSLPHFEAKTKEGVVSKNPWATTEGKAFKAKFEAENIGKELLNAEQKEIVWQVENAIKTKVLDHKELSGLFRGHRELSFYWRDAESGLLCKCRPDCLTPYGIISDLKVLNQCDEDSFQYSLAKSNYYIQAAWYLEGVKQALLQANVTDFTPPDSFVFVCVEKELPYAVAKYEAGQNSLELGRKVMRQALNKLAECEKSGAWPEYPEEIRVVEMPNWSFYKGGAK